MDNLSQKTISGLAYKLAERIGVQVVNFVVSIILARILMPEDYGTIALVTVFITILDVFVTYGFGNSLIVNKDSDDLDFSTCFFFGVCLALLIYTGVFFAAPAIANHYQLPILVPVIRVMALRIPIAAINSVQHAYVQKHMIFRKFFISTSIGTISSGIIAVIMAFSGCGIWALVTQYLGNVLIDTICLSFIVAWKPKFIFSFQRLKVIYDYGWKVLVGGLIDTGYSQLKNFVIADRYSRKDLAFYTRGDSFAQMGMTAIEPAVDGVVFPALSNCNDDLPTMKSMTRKLIKCTTYIVFPLYFLIMSVAKPLVLILIGEKWLEAVPFVVIGCLALFFRPVQIINNCVIKASGRSDMFLKLDIIKKSIGIVLLFLAIPFGVKAIAMSIVVVNLISTAINIWPNRKLLGYGYREQFMDVVPNLIIAVAMAVCVWLVSLLPINNIYLMFISQVAVALVMYFLFSVVSRSESYSMIKVKAISILKSQIGRKRNG